MGERNIAQECAQLIDNLRRITCLGSQDRGGISFALRDILSYRRPELGESVTLEYLRLVRVAAWQDILGSKGSPLAYAAGKRIGKQFNVRSLPELAEKINKMGLARTEMTSLRKSGGEHPEKIEIKFFESAVCAGVPLLAEPLCHLESGMLAGALEKILLKEVRVTETKCMAMGYDYCQFETAGDEEGSGSMIRERSDPSGYSEEGIRLLSTLTAHVASTLENTALLEHRKGFVVFDPLTALYNSDYLYTRLREEILRSERRRQSFALLMLEINRFEDFRHSSGDHAAQSLLKTCARILKENVRGTDVACRSGDHEFALILPETNGAGAVTVSERLQRSFGRFDLGKTPGKDAGNGKLTVCFGCTLYPGNSRYSEQLAEQARQALGKAMEAGGSKIEFYDLS